MCLSMEAFLLISQLAYQNSAMPIIKTTFFFFIMAASISVILSQLSHRKRKKSVRHVSLPPGPTPWPLVGCFPAMWWNTPPHRWIHAIMKQYNTEIACIRLGNTYIIPVTSPELSLEFLKTHDSIFTSRPVPTTTNILTRGFLTSALSPSGDQWKKMRKILGSQILNPSTLLRMSGHRTIEDDALLRHIFNESRSGGAVINLRSVTLCYCGNVIRRMLFNRRYYNDGGPTFKEEEEHIQALLTLLEHVHAFSVSDFVPCLKLFDLDGHKKTVKRAFEVIKKHDDSIIDERVQQWKDGKIKEVDDILDILISLRDDNGKSLLSIQEIKAEITELQMATIDNPSNAVEWAMAELLNRPEILKQAIEELDRIVGKDRLVQESDIPQLKYLRACIRESFRLHPFAPFNVPHVSNSDAIVAGYFIPKGSQVLLSRLGLGRNPRIWDDPLSYNPQRHLKDEIVELGLSEPNLRFISFSRGRRGCIGISLGTTITMMLFARLLQGFSWSLMPGTTKVNFSHLDELVLPNPLHLYAEPRLSHNMYPI